MKALVSILTVMCLCATVPTTADVLTVPAPYTTIQSAIDDADNGDIVQVMPGTYTETINFLGKTITVTGTDPEDPCAVAATIIDANGQGSAVTFDHGETSDAVLTGLTITGGTGTFVVSAGGTDLYWGGGICCNNSSPTIVRNVITNNNGPVVIDGNTPSVVSFGGGILSMAGQPLITRNTIRNNTAYFGAGIMVVSGDAVIKSNLIYDNTATYGGGAAPMFGGNLLANTIVENSAQIGGGVCLLSDEVSGTGLVANNIIYDNTDGGGIYADPNSLLYTRQQDPNGGPDFYIPDSIRFNDLNNNSPNDYFDTNDLTGLGGNIKVDPCFFDAAARDFRLKMDSLCIDAGDPQYPVAPNEIDYAGNPRIHDATIDIGAIEFQPNTPPVAVAGPNQTVYACLGDHASVTLDGSASYDNEDDPLEYYWSWTIGSSLCEANGICPVVELPLGTHPIDLVVDDGEYLSQTDNCVITVMDSIKAGAWFWPRTINCNSRPGRICVWLQLPSGIEPDDVENQPLIMYPGDDIQSKCQWVSKIGCHRHTRTMVFAVFDKSDICDCLPDGWQQVKITGQLTSGRCFYATTWIKIITPKPKQHRWPFWRCCFRHF